MYKIHKHVGIVVTRKTADSCQKFIFNASFGIRYYYWEFTKKKSIGYNIKQFGVLKVMRKSVERGNEC